MVGLWNWRREPHGWLVGKVKTEEPQLHPAKVKLLADPERQFAQFVGSRSSPQGARLFSTRFALLPASRAIHADAPGDHARGCSHLRILGLALRHRLNPLLHRPYNFTSLVERKGIHVR